MTITTDIEDLDSVDTFSGKVYIHTAKEVPSTRKRLLLLARDALRSDYLVINFEFWPVLLLGLLLRFTRCRLVTLDIFIPVQKSG
jgi:hypothetical protein